MKVKKRSNTGGGQVIGVEWDTGAYTCTHIYFPKCRLFCWYWKECDEN